MFSRWPVLLTLSVAEDEMDATSALSDAAIERLFAVGRASYFEQCHSFDPAATEISGRTVRRGDARISGGTVSISVGVVEVYPESFTMAARIRPAEGDDRDGISADARCQVLVSSGVTDAIRDELI